PVLARSAATADARREGSGREAAGSAPPRAFSRRVQRGSDMERLEHVGRPSTRQVPLRRWSLAELDAEILRVQRSAVREHLPLNAWRRLDRMRKRRAVLSKQ